MGAAPQTRERSKACETASCNFSFRVRPAKQILVGCQWHDLLKKLSDCEYKGLPEYLRKKALYRPYGPWLLKTSQYASSTNTPSSATFLLSRKCTTFDYSLRKFPFADKCSGKWQKRSLVTLVIKNSFATDNLVSRAEVLDDLLIQHRNTSKTAVCFFFCDALQQKETSLQAKTILGFLCRQYLQQSGDLDTVEPALSDFHEDNPTPNAEEIEEFFTCCIDGSLTTRINLDGLDDCNTNDRAVVLTALRDIMSRPSRIGTNLSANIELFTIFSLADDTQLNKLL